MQPNVNDAAWLYQTFSTALILWAIFYVCIGIMSHYLGRKKGYRGKIFLLAWIPFFNFFTFYLFVGLPDLIVRQKVDELTSK